jgi:hypothetical protein
MMKQLSLFCGNRSVGSNFRCLHSRMAEGSADDEPHDHDDGPRYFGFVK